jgi:hypothetical protein
MYKTVPHEPFCPAGKSVKSLLLVFLLFCGAAAHLTAGGVNTKKRQNVLDKIISIEL